MDILRRTEPSRSQTFNSEIRQFLLDKSSTWEYFFVGLVSQPNFVKIIRTRMEGTTATAAEAEAEAIQGAFLVLYGIGFGFMDVVLIGCLGAGALYYLLFRKSSSSADSAAQFQQYSIQ